MEAATFSRRSTRRARTPREARQRGGPPHPTFIRWLWIWITVGFLVVVVVIGFLLGIVSALRSINGGLKEANSAVTGIGAEAHPLPTFIQEINTNLTSIDGALKPISGQANQIVGALSSIRGKLVQINGSLVNTSGSLVNTTGSLVNTSGSLVNTSGSLVNTSNSLVDTSGTLGSIEGALVNISGTLAPINTTLAGPVNGVLGQVAGSLTDTNGKLNNISGSLVDISNRLKDTRSRAFTINRTLDLAEARNLSSGPFGSDGTQAIWRRVRFANGGSFFRPGFDNSLAGPQINPNGLKQVTGDAGTIIGALGQVNGQLKSICLAPVLHQASNVVVQVLVGANLVKPGPC